MRIAGVGTRHLSLSARFLESAGEYVHLVGIAVAVPNEREFRALVAEVCLDPVDRRAMGDQAFDVAPEVATATVVTHLLFTASLRYGGAWQRRRCSPTATSEAGPVSIR